MPITPETIEVFSNLCEALAVIIGACVVIQGINAWRVEMVGRRKAELAEEILAGIYQYRDLMDSVRSPISFQGEGDKRESSHEETEAERKYKNMYYVPIARLMQHDEFLARFHSLKYRFMAYFGTDAEEPFTIMNQIRNEVILSAHDLMSIYHDREEYNEENRALIKKWKADIGWVRSSEDPIRPRIEEAVKRIENICKPFLLEKI